MLDENLPTFFLKPSGDKTKHQESYLFTQNGSSPEATYALHHLDPAANDAKNTYAAALFDSYNPEILYGEVLSKPGWTQPTLSQEEIRKNGGLPPPPQPVFPTEFAIQLYNPDQQVVVRQQTAKWSSTVAYEFSLPQTSFRTPSASSLDRSLTDPGADPSTPKINFAWKKEGRLGKDMTCYMTGKSTDPTGKAAKKSKEPDITVALFSGLKELTIMEPNLYRVEMEDYKGFEVVLLLSAAVVRDIFFFSQRESFHIVDPNTRKNSGGLRGRKGSSPLEPGTSSTPPVMTPQPPPQPQRPSKPAATPNGAYNQPPSSSPAASKPTSRPALQTAHTQQPPNPRLDPRSQWEIDAESARLKAQVEDEERSRKRQEEHKQRARRKAEEEEARKTREFLAREDRQLKKQAEKERRRRQAETDKETERLRREYGDQGALLRPPNQQQQRHSEPLIQRPFGGGGGGHHHHHHGGGQRPQAAPPKHPPRPSPAPVSASAPYLHVSNHGVRPSASQSSFFSHGFPGPGASAGGGGGGGLLHSGGGAAAGPKMKKKSFWGLRSVSEVDGRLKKKQSSMF